jgi:adenine deaminase
MKKATSGGWGVQQVKPAILLICLFLVCTSYAGAQATPTKVSMKKAPARSEGEGPFPHLFLRNAILIDGTGAPPVGPVDIVIENNRITNIQVLADPGAPLEARTRANSADRELDLAGMYVLPGFIDMHTHIGPVTSVPAEYLYKLWLGHGITTIREV